MKIAVVGVGYVGISNAILLAQNNTVVALDTDKTRVEKINNQQSPIEDTEIMKYLKEQPLDLIATTRAKAAYSNAAYIIVATPTNYDTETKLFDTSVVEAVIKDALGSNSTATIIIKSTIPVGFTKKMRLRHKTDKIIFSPEFLREGRALHDNLYPSRIIMGSKDNEAKHFAKLLADGAIKKDIPLLFMESDEAEAVKLFANTYLAMRVAYFNELDTYAELHELETQSIIEGVSHDPRIGDHYNNPSFGYGGYCLPKDTKQLLATYEDIPNDLIHAIVAANSTRMDHVAERILSEQPKVVGIYRITMKTDSDNFRQSSILGVIQRLQNARVEIIIYEPSLTIPTLEGCTVTNDLQQFKEKADIIAANRTSADLADVMHKVYTRDLYNRD